MCKLGANQDNNDIKDRTSVLPRLNHCKNEANSGGGNPTTSSALRNAWHQQIHTSATRLDPRGLQPQDLHFSCRRQANLFTKSLLQDNGTSWVLSPNTHPAHPLLPTRAPDSTWESGRQPDQPRCSSLGPGGARQPSASPDLQLLAVGSSTSLAAYPRTGQLGIRESLATCCATLSGLGPEQESFEQTSTSLSARSIYASVRQGFFVPDSVGAKSFAPNFVGAKSFAPNFVATKSATPSGHRPSGRRPDSNSFAPNCGCNYRESTRVEPSERGRSSFDNRESTTVGPFEPPTISSVRRRHSKRDRSPAPHQSKASFAQGQEIARVGWLKYTTAVNLKQERRLVTNWKHLLKNKKKNAAIHFDSKLNSHKSYQRPLLSQHQRTRAWLNQSDAIVQRSSPTQVHPQLAPGIVQVVQQQGRFVTVNGRPLIQGGQYVTLKERFDRQSRTTPQGPPWFGSVPCSSVEPLDASTCWRPILPAVVLNDYFGLDSATIDQPRTTSHSSRAPPMELKFELDTCLTVSCIVAAVCSYGFVTVSISLNSASLAFANAIILLLIVFVLFGLDRFLARPRQVASTTR